jgi:DNA-binding transcriptional LysR family regulator
MVKLSKKFRYLVTLAEDKSFPRAAARLQIAQPLLNTS